jgi:DNA-binding MarR family transcriptional regulator
MDSEKVTTQKLMQAFLQYNKLHWKVKSISGLKPSEMMILICIHKNVVNESAGIKASELGNKLMVKPPTVTQFLKSLESGGYITRVEDENDRRAVRIRLTEKGSGLVNKASNAMFSTFSGLVRHLGKEDSDNLAELLTKVYTYISNLKYTE